MPLRPVLPAFDPADGPGEAHRRSVHPALSRHPAVLRHPALSRRRATGDSGRRGRRAAWGGGLAVGLAAGLVAGLVTAPAAPAAQAGPFAAVTPAQAPVQASAQTQSLERTQTGEAGSASFVAAARRQAASGVPSDRALAGASRTVLTPAALSGQSPAWSAGACTAEVGHEVDALRRQGSRVRAECSLVQVPLDWAAPALGSVTVHAVRIPRVRAAQDARPTRTLFVNPGGPGAAAGAYAVDLAEAEPDLRALYDIVALDPRGAGGSTPLDCPVIQDSLADYRRPSAAAIADQQRAARATVAGCVTRAGWYLPYISTAQTIADHEYVRSRLGASVVDWYVVSAGTWLAAHYAQAYPRRTGRVVLDSAVSLTQTWDQSFSLQPRGFQRRFEQQFLPWAARHPEYGLGSSVSAVRASYERVRTAAARNRYSATKPRDVDNLIVNSLYSDDDFPALASELAGLLDLAGGVVAPPALPPAVSPGLPPAVPSAAPPDVSPGAPPGSSSQGVRSTDREIARRSADDAHLTGIRPNASRVGDAAENTVFMAVQCNDTASPRDEPTQVTAGMSLGAAYPLVGWTWVANWCTYWPYDTPALKPPTGAGVDSMLLVQQELDPATPWEGASLTDRRLPPVRLLTVDNAGGHGAFARRNACVEGAVTSYLLTGALPAVGTVCPGTPLPGDKRVFEVGLRAPVHRIAAAAPIVPARSAAESLARDRARAAMFTPVR